MPGLKTVTSSTHPTKRKEYLKCKINLCHNLSLISSSTVLNSHKHKRTNTHIHTQKHKHTFIEIGLGSFFTQRINVKFTSELWKLVGSNCYLVKLIQYGFRLCVLCVCFCLHMVLYVCVNACICVRLSVCVCVCICVVYEHSLYVCVF